MTILPLVFALVVTGTADLAMNIDHAGRSIGRRLAVVLIGLLLMSAVVAALIVLPLLAIDAGYCWMGFARAVAPAQLVAAGTQSSIATLPAIRLQ